jgi:hypothetical protein
VLPPDTPGPMDRLLQGLQGLVLHLHAIAGDLPSDEPVRAALERWLDSAEQLMHQGCADGGVEARRGPVGAVATLLGLARMAPPQAARTPPLRLRVRLGSSPQALMPGVQRTLSQIACDQARRACQDAGATWVDVRMQAAAEGLVVSVSDNGRWAGAPDDLPAQQAWRSAGLSVGAQVRIWRWPFRGGQWQLRLPARQAYATGSSSERETASRRV